MMKLTPKQITDKLYYAKKTGNDRLYNELYSKFRSVAKYDAEPLKVPYLSPTKKSEMLSKINEIIKADETVMNGGGFSESGSESGSESEEDVSKNTPQLIIKQGSDLDQLMAELHTEAHKNKKLNPPEESYNSMMRCLINRNEGKKPVGGGFYFV